MRRGSAGILKAKFRRSDNRENGLALNKPMTTPFPCEDGDHEAVVFHAKEGSENTRRVGTTCGQLGR